MTRYEWHEAKARELEKKAQLCLSVVDNLDDRLQNSAYGIWANHANDLTNHAAFHESVMASMTVEEASQELYS